MVIEEFSTLHRGQTVSAAAMQCWKIHLRELYWSYFTRVFPFYAKFVICLIPQFFCLFFYTNTLTRKLTGALQLKNKLFVYNEECFFSFKILIWFHLNNCLRPRLE